MGLTSPSGAPGAKSSVRCSTSEMCAAAPLRLTTPPAGFCLCATPGFAGAVPQPPQPGRSAWTKARAVALEGGKGRVCQMGVPAEGGAWCFTETGLGERFGVWGVGFEV